MTVEEFEEFYVQAVGRLTGQLYVMLGDLQEAEDVVQEAFVKGWNRRRQLDREAGPEAWIRTVAWRLAVSRWRIRRRTADAWSRRETPSHTPGPGPEHVVLVEALRSLPAQQRRTLTLHYLCDLTVDQIARETGLSASTVKTHLGRGRAALADRLRDPAPDGLGPDDDQGHARGSARGTAQDDHRGGARGSAQDHARGLARGAAQHDDQGTAQDHDQEAGSR